MGDTIFREIHGADAVVEAAADAVAWGFPRAIENSEIALADWFRVEGHDVVFWFEHYDQITSTWFVHLAVGEASRKRWPRRQWLRFIEEHPRDHGATELGFVRCPGSDQSEGYLRRLGWGETHFGLAKPLGV